MMSMETTTPALCSAKAGDGLRLSSYGSADKNLVRSCFSANPKLRLLRPGSTHKRFDSGDWCMERLGLHCKDEVPLEVSVDQLSPKLCPEPTDLAERRPPSVLQHSRSDFDAGYAVGSHPA